MKRPKYRKVYCEISNSCNLKCNFCPSAADSEEDKRFMDEELFEKLIPQLQKLTYILCLHVMGEPMYHPRLGKLLDICARHKMKVSIVTNGTLIAEQHQQLLMHPAVVQINFSLQSFETNFPDADNNKYLKNIFNFITRSFTERPDLHINLRLWNSENFARSMVINKPVIDLIQQHFSITDEVIENLSPRGNRLVGDLYINFSDRFEWPTLDLPFQSDRGTCAALKNQFGILADGTVIPCCLDKGGIIDLGNCNDNTLEEILSAERAMNMLNGFKQQRLVEPLCQNCTFNDRFKK